MSAPRWEACASARGIPYAVGVDIACRMKLTVYDRKANTLAGQRDRLAAATAEGAPAFPA